MAKVLKFWGAEVHLTNVCIWTDNRTTQSHCAIHIFADPALLLPFCCSYCEMNDLLQKVVLHDPGWLNKGGYLSPVTSGHLPCDKIGDFMGKLRHI